MALTHLVWFFGTTVLSDCFGEHNVVTLKDTFGAILGTDACWMVNRQCWNTRWPFVALFFPVRIGPDLPPKKANKWKTHEVCRTCCRYCGPLLAWIWRIVTPGKMPKLMGRMEGIIHQGKGGSRWQYHMKYTCKCYVHYVCSYQCMYFHMHTHVHVHMCFDDIYLLFFCILSYSSSR